MKRAILGLGGCLFLAVSAVSWGQEPADPPSRVARLSLIQGSASFRPDSVEDWSAATLNYPLSTGDHLWTDENSYADLHIGATAIHLAPQTAFALSYLNDTVTQMSLTQGSLYVRIASLDKGEVIEIDTPNGAVSLLQAGAYRVDVDGEPSATFVRVREGVAETTANGHVYQSRPGAMLRLVAGQDGLETVDAATPDGWELQCAARDQLAEQYRTISESYVPAEVDGVEDLAQYGEWSADPTYGEVWSPAAVAADWAPYRNGRWLYVPHSGWTWMDDAKWGFAPFHYGRWLVANEHWVWVPGKREVHPMYAPALVAFVGGLRFNPTLAPRRGPLMAWLPLGPGEPYRPQRPVSANYLRRVNGADAAGATPVAYRNREGTTAVPEDIFRGAKPVSGARVQIPQGGTVAVAPVSVSTIRPLPVHAPAGMAAPPAEAVSRTVIAKHEIPRNAVPAVPVVSSSSQVNSPAPAAAAPRQSPPQQRVEPVRSVQQTGNDSHVEQDRADQQRSEQRRIEQQRSEQQWSVQQRSEQGRQEQQRTDQQRAEQQRSEQQRTDQQRVEQGRQEQQRTEQQRSEQQRTDQQRTEQLRQEQQRAQQQRSEEQRSEQQRSEQGRQEQQRTEQQRTEQQRQEQQHTDQQRTEQLRQERQRAEQQRAEQQRQEQQRGDQQRAEQQRAEQQRQEQQRQEQQRTEMQRAMQQRQEQQRADQQRAEQQRQEQQRAEQQRQEQQRQEQQRQEQQRAEMQRAEQQRQAQQRQDDQKRADDAKKAEEARKKQ